MSNEYNTNSRVIITRAEAQAARISTLVEDAGGVAIRVPALEICPADHPQMAQTIFDRLEDYQSIIFISPNAVRYSIEFVESDAFNQCQCLAIGAGTAQAMKLADIECDGYPKDSYTSEALLELPQLAEVKGRNILIVRGNGGRPFLGNELSASGANVDYAEVYSRQVPKSSAPLLNATIAAGGADLILANSVETLSNIVSITDQDQLSDLQQLQLITGSPRVAQKAQDLGFTQPALLANGPDDQALMAAITEWSASQTTAAHAVTDITGSTLNTSPPSTESKEEVMTDDKTTPPEAVPENHNQHADEALNADLSELEAQVTETTAQTAAKPAKRAGGGIAWLALLAALLAGGASGWTWWQSKNQAPVEVAQVDVPSRDEISAEIRQLTSQQSTSVSGELDQQADRIENALDKQNEFASSLRTQKRSVENLTDQLSQMENSISAMRGVSANVRNTWVRAETEYFLQTANTRLQLAGDINSAIQALKAADERIVALGDPSLTPVRAQLNEDLFVLESLPKLDIEGIALTINSLAQRVDDLPILNESPENYTESNTKRDSEGQSTWDRTKDAFSGALGNVVRFTPSDGETTALLAPQQAYFLHRNLQLQLQTARMAALQGQQVTFLDSLTSALAWTQKYFDNDDSGVSTMIERLETLSTEKVTIELPDISKSLNMIRNKLADSGSSRVTPRAATPSEITQDNPEQ